MDHLAGNLGDPSQPAAVPRTIYLTTILTPRVTDPNVKQMNPTPT